MLYLHSLIRFDFGAGVAIWPEIKNSFKEEKVQALSGRSILAIKAEPQANAPLLPRFKPWAFPQRRQNIG